ncbi:unnamed protein product, partial [Iphiclides podalirius]
MSRLGLKKTHLGVGQIYNELRSKGVEFPMTDLDAMAPIFTPQRSVPDGPEQVVGSPQRAAPPQHSPGLQTQEPVTSTVTLSDSQTSKLRADLSVVEGNMTVMNDMLNELTTQPHTQHHDSDIELLNELADTLRAMQSRVAELVARLAGDSPLTADLLHANDRLNNLLLRHSRFLNNRDNANDRLNNLLLRHSRFLNNRDNANDRLNNLLLRHSRFLNNRFLSPPFVLSPYVSLSLSLFLSAVLETTPTTASTTCSCATRASSTTGFYLPLSFFLPMSISSFSLSLCGARDNANDRLNNLLLRHSRFLNNRFLSPPFVLSPYVYLLSLSLSLCGARDNANDRLNNLLLRHSRFLNNRDNANDRLNNLLLRHSRFLNNRFLSPPFVLSPYVYLLSLSLFLSAVLETTPTTASTTCSCATRASSTTGFYLPLSFFLPMSISSLSLSLCGARDNANDRLNNLLLRHSRFLNNRFLSPPFVLSPYVYLLSLSLSLCGARDNANEPPQQPAPAPLALPQQQVSISPFRSFSLCLSPLSLSLSLCGARDNANDRLNNLLLRHSRFLNNRDNANDRLNNLLLRHSRFLNNRFLSPLSFFLPLSPLSLSLSLCGARDNANDRLNNLLLRHSRFLNNRNAATGGATPSAILGAAMGVPVGADSPAKKTDDDALIDLSDDVPDVSKLSVGDGPVGKSPGSAKDEFDMFAQSRNVSYETTKTGGSSYADNSEELGSGGLAAAVGQRPLQAPLAASEASGTQESVTSSDFDKFLAERAAAAENLPNVNDDRGQNSPQQTPRHRQIKKEEQDSMFAL